MKSSYLLLPIGILENPDGRRDQAPIAITGFVSLWHPALLADAASVPAVQDLQEVPGEEDALLVVPRPAFDSASELVRGAITSRPTAPVIIAPDCLDPLGHLASLSLPAVDPDLLDDFFAFGFAYLGLEVLYRRMSRASPLDDAAVLEDVRRAAELALEGNRETAREELRYAHEQLCAARQHVYPATISVCDFALYHPQVQDAHLAARLGHRAPLNLMISGRDLDQLAARDPVLLTRLRESNGAGSLEVLGSMWQDRSFGLLPLESRFFELDRAQSAHEQHLGRLPEGFASRSGALTADLPQLLMKFSYRHAFHACFDGSRIPYFREPKLHWTAADGSVIESLCRVAVNASSMSEGLLFFERLARTISEDRAATLVLAHWAHQPAAWYRWLLRAQDLAETFGKFTTLADYFLQSYTAEPPTRTHVEDYATGALERAVGRSEPDPISRWTDHLNRRGTLDTALTLDSLAAMLGRESDHGFEAIENQLEEGLSEAAAEAARVADGAARALADVVLAGASAGRGYLILNPCGHARRACIEVRADSGIPVVEGPVRVVQPMGNVVKAVVDVPGWGFSWIAKRDASVPPEKAPPIASGRRLRNEFLEVEVDSKTGGIRGIWPVRTGYSRLAQQLVHSSEGSRPVARSIEVTQVGPAVGEIESRGQIVDAAGKRVFAQFRQQVRLWLGRPLVEIDIELEVNENVTGAPLNNYLSSRWAWPDEKTTVAPATGLHVEPSRASELESVERIELRERNLITNLFPAGAAFHRRIGARMMDTLLVVQGERRRRFTMMVAVDVAHPWHLAQEQFRPVAVLPVDRGPPVQGRTGWFLNLAERAILCTRLARAGPGTFRMRLAETTGKSVRAELRLPRDAASARLTNARGHLVFELYPDGSRVPVDFAPEEILQVEVKF